MFFSFDTKKEGKKGDVFLQTRTDLAWEAAEKCIETEGLNRREWEESGVHFSRLTISKEAEAVLEKPAGEYLTASLPPLTDHEEELENIASVLGKVLRECLPPSGTVLVVGLGNRAITPDALGPLTAGHVLATRHIRGEFARSAGLDDLRPTAVITPDVLGNTGIESSETVAGVCRMIHPCAVIAVDALAAKSLERLGCTVQMSDSGIAPGSGVGNNRRALCREQLGVPVIGLGVPTVVDAATVARELTGAEQECIAPHGTAMMVTPREVDLMVERASRLLAMTIHVALQPGYSPLELLSLA